MENASKALIIAGAILLSILLISLGIMIFTQAQDTVNNNGMSEAEIAAFNNKFLKYEGAQSGTVVRAMLNEVLASNANNESNKIVVRLGPTENSLSVIISTYQSGGYGYTGKEFVSGFSMGKIVTNNTYTVNLKYSKGYVNEIHIIGSIGN